MLRFQKFAIYPEIRAFIKECFKLSHSFPKFEQFELASQLRRAATSILLNLAEGSAKKSDAELNRFIMVSIGSLSEIVAILDIALDQGYINQEIYKDFLIKVESIAKQLYGFSRKLKS